MAAVIPLFVDPEILIDRMQLDSGITGVLPEVQKALLRSQLYVESKLGGTLTRRTWDSMFYLDGEAFSGIQPNGLFRVELPTGCVRRDTPVTVRTSEQAVVCNLPDWGRSVDFSEGAFGPLTEADPALYRLDYNRGYLMMDAKRYRNRYIQVVFESGFEPGTNPAPVVAQPEYDPAITYQKGDEVQYLGTAWVAQLKDLTGIAPDVTGTGWAIKTIPMEGLPGNINEAILTYAPTILDAQTSKDRAAERSEKFNLADNYIQELLDPYRRYLGFSFRAIWSE
jgi:hypothetical protein